MYDVHFREHLSSVQRAIAACAYFESPCACEFNDTSSCRGDQDGHEGGVRHPRRFEERLSLLQVFPHTLVLCLECYARTTALLVTSATGRYIE